MKSAACRAAHRNPLAEVSYPSDLTMQWLSIMLEHKRSASTGNDCLMLSSIFSS